MAQPGGTDPSAEWVGLWLIPDVGAWLSLFEEREDGGYDRSDESQCERCYSQEELRKLLEQTGFELLGCFGDWDFSEPKDDCERYYFVARAKK